MEKNYLIRVMRLMTLFLLGGFLSVSAAGFSQNISLSGKNVALTDVFTAVYRQSGYRTAGTEGLLEIGKPVSINVQNMPLNEFLRLVMRDQPLNYQLLEKNIILSRKPLTASNAAQPSAPVSFRVWDANGKPLRGATFSSRSAKNNAILGLTNSKGLLALNVSAGEHIVVSFVGFEPFPFVVTDEIVQAGFYAISLKLSDNPLSEVVINKGYYSETQELATGNAVTINAKDIEKQPVINPLLAIQGRVAGLQITQTSGIINGPQNILIRGKSSLNSAIANDPLYVVDGVPYQSRLLTDVLGNNGGNGSLNNTPQGSPLNYINPSDISSITVLKDADATAIYGSRGGNGVILITTKKGQPGAMTLGVNIIQGIMPAPEQIKLMNTEQYLDMRREAFRNDGVPLPDIQTSPEDPNYDINGTWSQTKYTDWQKELIGNMAGYTNLNLSLGGGSDLIQYTIRGTYNRQGNLYPGGFDDNRGSLSFNLSSSSRDKKFTIDFTGNLLRDNNQNAQSDATAYTFRAPNAPDSFNPDGTLNFGTSPYYDNSNNPYAYTLRTYGNKTDNITISIKPTYHIVAGLSASANIGYTDLRNDIEIKQPMASYSPLYIAAVSAAGINALLVTDNLQRTWIVEPQLNYLFKINDFKFDALAGTSFQSSLNDGHTYAGNSFVSDVVIGNIANAGALIVQDNGSSTYHYNAVYARFNANLKDKYVINLTGRRDGSSKFGPGKQFGNFYSAAGAWIFSNESVIKNALSVLSFGKLRASYGTSGNDNISDYAYYDLYRSRGTNLYQGMTGFAPSSLANPNVAWEKNAKLEFAMDLGFFNDRLFATAAYYRNRSSNQLLSYTIPSFTGFSSVPNYNFPALVQNSGLEFTLNTRNIASKSFTWTSDFNISFNRNKLLKFDGIENTSYSQYLAIGQPIVGRAVSWIYTGIDPETGLFTALKYDGTVGSDAGNYVSTTGAYQTTVNNTAPKFFGGINNTFRYGNLQLDIFLQFVKQTGRLDIAGAAPGYFATTLSDQVSYTPSNVPVEFLDRWQQPGDRAKYQRFTQSAAGIKAYGTWSQSDAAYVDASFIRAKNIMLSYQLPAALKGKLKLKNASLSLSGQNLFKITPYKGRDPETQSYSILPPQRVFVLGLQVNL